MSRIKDQLSKDQDTEFEMWIGYEDYLIQNPEPSDEEICKMEKEVNRTCYQSIATQCFDKKIPENRLDLQYINKGMFFM